MAGDFQLTLFRALLQPNTPVDGARLRRAAMNGVPAEVRPDVWNYLLGVAQPAADAGRADYAARLARLDLQTPAARRVRSALKRARVSRPDPADVTRQAPNRAPARRSAKLRQPDTDTSAAILRVVALYLSSAPAVEFHCDMLFIAAPFLEVMPSEADAYFAFAALMQKAAPLFTPAGLADAVGGFRKAFRFLFGDLHELLVSEEVDMNAWVPSWLRSLLARHLPRDALLRLWDAYFVGQHGDCVQLHPYVCVVLVAAIRGDLQDCEDGERIAAILARPSLAAPDPSRTLASANDTREKLKGAGVI